MKLYSEGKNYKLYHGSMLDMLEVIEPNSIDSIITDPPYELNFMNKGWDNAGISFQKDTWRKCFEVLKPGGYLLAFGGSRTFHRIACAIEDAGFEIRDTIMWLYGSGFPKSMNIGKAIEAKEKLGNSGSRAKKEIELSCKGKEYIVNQSNNGIMGELKEFTRKDYIPGTDNANKWYSYGTALKPAFEPIIVARKPVENSVADNVLKYSVGGINIDECRIYGDESINCHNTQSGTFAGKVQTIPKFREKGLSFGQYEEKAERIEYTQHEGRFPSNVILTYDETDKQEVCGGMPYTKSEGGNAYNKENGDNSMFGLKQMVDDICFHDEGSAARYYYCAKASKKDRDEGLYNFENSNINDGRKAISDRPYLRKETLRKNTHPTVKPTELMQYLVRLVSPKGATILDCFNGSGSTGKAVMFENRERDANYKYIGIELTPDYLPIAKARIEFAINYVDDDVVVINDKEQIKKISIFDIIEDK